ncbi:hypothetical protein ACJBLD_16915 [Acinetobacter nosocomialis]|uniref:hypothetical protein n=1 Tax=Acinetobacter nosocomialis TaxID=106654 RepID=UPI0025A0ED98|nr:hypothetical protein [Acinetobacter nosocomialis]
MTVRGYAKCEICGFNILLKIGEGSESFQPHIFDCPECFTSLSVALRLTEYGHAFEPGENCTYPDNEEIEKLDLLPNNKIDKSIICLHSDFAFNKDQIHDPLGAATVKLNSIGIMVKYATKRWPMINPDNHIKIRKGPLFLDIAHYFDVPDCKNIWTSIIKPYYTMTKNNNLKIIETLKNKYIFERKKYVPKVNIKQAEDMYYDFFSSMFYPRFNNIYIIINNAIVKAKQNNPKEFSRFIEFYKNERWPNSEEHMIQIFNEYFSYTTEFAQMRVYARIDNSDVEDLIVGSKNFDKTKLFYGNAYEVITDEYIFLAGIFNILSGRNFDQFCSMTLNKYINDVNKDSRSSPLKSYTPFNDFLNEMDSTLRNGSHHASIRRDGEIIYYRSGGTGAIREIEYSKYLYLCNRLMILSTVIFCLENKWLNK